LDIEFEAVQLASLKLPLDLIAPLNNCFSVQILPVLAAVRTNLLFGSLLLGLAARSDQRPLGPAAARIDLLFGSLLPQSMLLVFCSE
jgi:hypothetical protein